MNYKMIDPTPEKWDIYDALIPQLDHNAFRDSGVPFAHLERRTIDKISNHLSVSYWAESESDFFNIKLNAMKIILTAGLDFIAVNETINLIPIEHTVMRTCQLAEHQRNMKTWDNFISLCSIVDNIAGELEIKNNRILTPKYYAIVNTSRFLNWSDYATYNFRIGGLFEKNNIKVDMVENFPKIYQGDLFDDILDLTDTTRDRMFANINLNGEKYEKRY
tara:strand:+ start:711 stop:1367 length:657 start_codon:yes stop_codon:yes gene_type:complete